MLKILDRLEEMADRLPDGRGDAADLRRRRAPLRRRLADPGGAGLAAHAQPVLGAGALHLHVRLDGEVRRRLRRAHRHPRRRRRADQPPADRTRARTCCSACLPARCSPRRRHARRALRLGHRRTPTRSPPTSKLPMWIVYLCIPLGSYLMCFRFLQVAWSFCKTGELPHHDDAHVEGSRPSRRSTSIRTAPG